MKRCVLSFFRNSHRDLHCLSSQGRLFHNFGPHTQNARSPPYLRLVRGTFRLCWLTLRLGRFCSGTESSATRYSGAFFRPQPKSWGPIELGCPSVCLSVCPSVRLSVCPSVCHRFLVRARTFERKVIETWL